MLGLEDYVRFWVMGSCEFFRGNVSMLSITWDRRIAVIGCTTPGGIYGKPHGCRKYWPRGGVWPVSFESTHRFSWLVIWNNFRDFDMVMIETRIPLMVDIIKPYLEDNTSSFMPCASGNIWGDFNREFQGAPRVVALGSHIPVVLSILGDVFCENYMPHDGSMGLDIYLHWLIFMLNVGNYTSPHGCYGIPYKMSAVSTCSQFFSVICLLAVQTLPPPPKKKTKKISPPLQKKNGSDPTKILGFWNLSIHYGNRWPCELSWKSQLLSPL